MILTEKRVLLTGGTGSLGKAFLARAEKESWDTDFVIFSRDETKQSQVRSIYPQYQYVLGDVAKIRDIKRALYGVDTIIHLAAYKQIPSAQANVAATVETNVLGSLNIAELAVEYGIEKVVATSTDKACAPANAYGRSKALMEDLFQEANKWGETEFYLTRYGNVVCSNASVIPLFLKQKKAGGPLTITDSRMTRFWISLNQAVDLVLLALQQDPGTIVVPKAPAMTMKDLAEGIADGLPVKDIGIRPGEKVHESMVSLPESIHTREEERHFFIYPPTTDFSSGREFEYSSNRPSRWLTEIELWDMILEAGF